MRSPMMRASVSVGPPAENGTTIVIERDGYVCAEAMVLIAIVANASTANSVFMELLLWSLFRAYIGMWLRMLVGSACSIAPQCPGALTANAPRGERVMYAEPFSPPEFHACSSICNRASAA